MPTLFSVHNEMPINYCVGIAPNQPIGSSAHRMSINGLFTVCYQFVTAASRLTVIMIMVTISSETHSFIWSCLLKVTGCQQS